MEDKGVLFVTGTLEVGGSETKIARIANALAESGVPVGVAYCNPPETLLERIQPGVCVTHLQRRGKYSLRSLRILQGLIASYGVIMAVNFYPLLYVLPAVKRSGCRVRSVALVNTTVFVDRQWVHGHLYAPFLRRCDRLVYGCRAQQALWSRKYKLPEERSTCIYNGVDTDFYSPTCVESRDSSRTQWGIPRDAVVIGSVGRLAPEKDFGLLIDAVADLRRSGRDAWLLIVGEGRERANLEASIARAGLSGKAMLPGALPDVRPAIAAMDVFVLPSRAVETFSNAALEAMSMQRPVLLTNVGGAAEMVEEGESGYLFEAGDSVALRNLLGRLCDSEELRRRVGAAARERVTQRFRFDTMLDGYEALIAGSDR